MSARDKKQQQDEGLIKRYKSPHVLQETLTDMSKMDSAVTIAEAPKPNLAKRILSLSALKTNQFNQHRN